jgi:hypothetical protein
VALQIGNDLRQLRSLLVQIWRLHRHDLRQFEVGFDQLLLFEDPEHCVVLWTAVAIDSCDYCFAGRTASRCFYSPVGEVHVRLERYKDAHAFLLNLLLVWVVLVSMRSPIVATEAYVFVQS